VGTTGTIGSRPLPVKVRFTLSRSASRQSIPPIPALLMSHTLLLVDEDPVRRRLLEAMAHRLGYEIQFAETGVEALSLLMSDGGVAVDLVILSVTLRDLDAITFMGRLREAGVALPVIVQAAQGRSDVVLAAIRAGAADFLVHPAGDERVQVSIKNALRTHSLENEVRRVRHRTSGMLGFKDLVARSEDMSRVTRLAERAAKSSVPVLIEGEQGTGKEMLARAIQGSGDRRAKPFVVVRCGAIAEPLIEATLFGREKGATGSDRQTGKIAEAHGGTLFLDDVGELPLLVQEKLLRVILDGEVMQAGARKASRVDLRVIATTRVSLLDLVKRGRFREDLYYRLNVLPITVPPLRARREDIGELASLFMARFAAEDGKRLRRICAEALALLARYDWPGNVRQLENAVLRAVALAETDELTVAEFPQIAAQVEGFDIRIPPAPAVPEPHLQPVREVVRVEIRDPYAISLVEASGDMRRLDDLEAEIIRFALAHYRGHMSEVSRRLGIGRSTLYRKLKDLGLENETTDAAA